MPIELNDVQRAALRAVCDAVVPRIERPDDPDGFWARTASEIGVPEAIEQTLAVMPEEQQAGMAQLLDAFAGQNVMAMSQPSAEQILRNTALMGPDAAAGVNALVGMTLFYAYGIPDEAGQNPNWRTFGYPGPVSPPPPVEKPIRPVVPDGDTLELEGDVCVVGSGAGGGVIAGTLAQQGLKVVVLEAGGYFNEADFNQLELWAYQNAYWRGGPNPTADLNITLQAGACLGGGTTINWTNSLRTKPWVRDEWANEYGLEGVDGADFDRHLDTVFERSSVNDRCSDFNDVHKHMQAGAEALGWSFQTILRNTDPASYDPASAGYLGFGDQSGSKQGTMKTYLQDAFDAGADIVTRCWAERVIVESGRAAGVEGVWMDPETGRSARVTVRAPQVVVACGALESPGLLLRSQIGGPAAGQYLRLHPANAVVGLYPEPQEPWWGAPQTALVDEFVNAEADHGFLVEGAQYGPGIFGSSIPFTTAAEHKSALQRFRHGASFVALIRDRGYGRVEIDAAGQPVHWYSLTDELDIRNTFRSIDAQVRLHAAAGAVEIYGLAAGMPIWRWGDDLDAYLETLRRIPLGAGGWRLFSAHQMGSCRMGTDSQTSVAGPWGELHDTPGVWIGDGSAFPTPPGTNPMMSVMALAHRTAEAISGKTTETEKTPELTARS